MKKILVYSHDTYGLGNIRRMLAIVEDLVARNPEVSVLVLSGSPMLQAFRLSPRVDYIKLPCLERDANGEYGSKFLELSYQSLLSLRADLILNTVLNFEPDLILVDKKPLGVQNEMAPALDVLRRRANRAKLVLLLREILDEPQVTISVWERNGYHDTIRELYDRVLVLGSPEVFDTVAEYQFPQSTREKLTYCGYIAKKPCKRLRETVLSELGIDAQRFVVVTPGGGKDGYRMLDTVLSAIAAPNCPPNVHYLLCFGPEMDSDERSLLSQRVEQGSNVTVMDYTADMLSYLNAADLVVSMAGYNTVTELLALSKPAILVPRTAPVQEQWMRATRMEKLNRFSVIHPDQLTVRAFLAVLRRSLNDLGSDPQPVKKIDMNALGTINDSLMELLGERSRKGWSEILLEQAGVETGEFAEIRRTRLMQQ